jgi:hypothetical protein
MGFLYLYKGGRVEGGWRGNIMPSSSFSFDGVHVFLTYPQCSLEREKLRDFLRDLVPECQYIVARELHSDGAYHLHAYAHFGRRKRFASAAAFDLDGFHPNIQRPRSARDVVAYCRKEDTEPLVSDGLDAVVGPGKTGWGDILAVATSEGEFLELTRESFPRDYVLHNGPLLDFCRWRFGRDETPYVGRERSLFREPVALTDWVTTNLTEVLICNAFLTLTASAGGSRLAASA